MVSTALRQISGKHRTETGDTRLGAVLAFVAGAINAGGFLAVGAYTSHMSGWVSSVADFIAVHQLQAAGLAAACVLAFFGGAVLSSLLINWARRRRLHSEFAIALMVEAVLLLVFGVLASSGVMEGPAGLHALIAYLCLIMGLQNGLITKISHAEIRTTHMTGVITDLGIETGRLLFGKITDSDVRYDRKKAGRLALLLTAFLTGALSGAVAFKTAGYISVVPLALALAVMALPPIADDLKGGGNL